MNPWTSCKALPGGPAPTLGKAVLSLGEIHRWDFPATSRLWMPGALPGLWVCAGGLKHVGQSPHPALGLHWGKIQKHQQKEKGGASNRLPSLDSGGTRIVGSTAKVTCCAACTWAGGCGACSPHCCGTAGKGRHVPVSLPARSDGCSHPPERSQQHQWARCVTPALPGLSCSAVVQ